MASPRFLTPEENYLCSICLHEFTEPVSTPCGHNYCKACITEYWDTLDLARCPLCKKQFHTRPQLQVNTEFRDMVGRFNNMRWRSGENIPAKPGEVPCDICTTPKIKAQKTCLLCLSSYCHMHLELHREVTSSKRHQLIDPVSNLEARVCKKHDKVFEFFCHVDQTCVCFMCLKDDHATHKAAYLQQEITKRKAQLADVAAEMKTTENAKSRSIREIKYSVEQSKKQVEEELEEIAEIFTDLILSLQKCQTELTELIKGKQEAAEKGAKAHLTKLEQEVAELRKRRSEMKQLLQTDDDLQILLAYPSLDSSAHENQIDPLSHFNPPLLPELSDIPPQTCVGMVRKCAAQIEKTFSNEMGMLIHEVRLSDGFEAVSPDESEKPLTDEFIEEVWNPPQDELMMIQQCHAVDVTLDAYTANLRLSVSGDGKQLRGQNHQSILSFSNGKRFFYNPLVLGKEGFSSGRFYFQVRVSGCNNWLLGVAQDSVHGEGIYTHSPEDGYWTYAASTP
ncbi:E3 ubiquitin/ISG15 ligase TRIM25-like [Halichoeres trimaculatus]|uniref:E3 ubiquitin/ISG15 ligase TRIM25-like n=1 Tax=Halichoeres trimaculatus TaxID=147232 RepID=UPI003D9F1F9D